MENVELDIEKYDLVDLLKLFKLDYDFGKEDLKQAKKNCIDDTSRQEWIR